MKKKKIILLTIFMTVVSFFSCCDKQNNRFSELKGDYLGQTPPKNKPVLFAPGMVSTGFHDMDITLSPQLDEIFFTRSSPYDWYASIIYLKRINGKWIKQKLAPFINSATYRISYPFISPKGDKIYFNSAKPIPGIDEQFVNNIWYSIKNKSNEWEAARPLSGVNTNLEECFSSISNNGTIYFYANYEDSKGEYDIYCRKLKDNLYGDAENLGININSESSEYHPYISPDESYIIFDRTLPDGNFDLFISYKNDDGSWSKSVNMGETINDPIEADIRPYVSPDGKYLFFSSTRSLRKNQSDSLTYSDFMKHINGPGNYSQDIYWVDANIIEKLRTKKH